MTETKKSLWIGLACVLVVAVLLSAGASIFAAKGVYDLRAEAAKEEETREDDVSIMSQYTIRSTLPISDAYLSGNTNGLDEKQKETLDMAKAVLDEIITEDMTPYDKEKAVYDWMTSELSYDTGILQVIPQTTADCDNPYGVLKYHNAVCVGYATTFRLLMQMMEIPCMVVHSTDEFHSWNLVKLDDAWYHVDIYSDQSGGSYANFNMNDELAGMSHDWDRTFFPAATSLDHNYAYQNRVTVEDRFQVPKMVRKATDERSRTLFLAFPGIDEAGAQEVENMFYGIEAAVAETPDLQYLSIQRTWFPAPGGEFVLGVFLEGYLDDEETEQIVEIKPETQEKIDKAVQDAFGDIAVGVDHSEDMGGEWG